MRNVKIKKKAMGEKENMAKNIHLISIIRCLIQLRRRIKKNNKESAGIKDQMDPYLKDKYTEVVRITQRQIYQ